MAHKSPGCVLPHTEQTLRSAPRHRPESSVGDYSGVATPSPYALAIVTACRANKGARPKIANVQFERPCRGCRDLRDCPASGSRYQCHEMARRSTVRCDPEKCRRSLGSDDDGDPGPDHKKERGNLQGKSCQKLLGHEMWPREINRRTRKTEGTASPVPTENIMDAHAPMLVDFPGAGLAGSGLTEEGADDNSLSRRPALNVTAQRDD